LLTIAQMCGKLVPAEFELTTFCKEGHLTTKPNKFAKHTEHSVPFLHEIIRQLFVVRLQLLFSTADLCKGGEGSTIDYEGLSVVAGEGLTIDYKGLSVVTGEGSTIDYKGLSVVPGKGSTIDYEGLSGVVGEGLTIDYNGLSKVTGVGSSIDYEGLSG